MDKDSNQEIEDLIDGLRCPNEFICYKSGFEKLSRVRDFGLESFLECLDGNSVKCKFSVYFGNIYFCQCPLRIYIWRQLKK